VARRDDKPVGFAIVEFADVAVAERTCNKLKSLKIGGRRVELQMCMPGQSVPEAFHQQMSLLVRLVSLRPLFEWIWYSYFIGVIYNKGFFNYGYLLNAFINF